MSDSNIIEITQGKFIMKDKIVSIEKRYGDTYIYFVGGHCLKIENSNTEYYKAIIERSGK